MKVYVLIGYEYEDVICVCTSTSIDKLKEYVDSREKVTASWEKGNFQILERTVRYYYTDINNDLKLDYEILETELIQ